MGHDLAGQTALVTGAARRLGREIALELARAGVSVVIHYGSSVADAERTREELEHLGVRAWTEQADLSSPNQAAALVERVTAAAGPLDILVNNASVFAKGSLADVSFGQICEQMAVNAWAPLALTRAFAAQGQPGKIINLLDTRVAGYDWSHVAYILSKNALELLTRMLALEFAPRVTVNAVAPGLVLAPDGASAGLFDRLSEAVPMRRPGLPEDIAEAVMFLLRSSFITGQTIFVDGGAHLIPQPPAPPPG